MNSRIVKAKHKQNYQDKPLARRCRECRYLSFLINQIQWGVKTEKLRCTLGDFAVKPNAICDEFETKETL